MFRGSAKLCRISSFALFMKDNAKNSQLKGLGGAQRGKVLAQMFKNQSESQKNVLRERARHYANQRRRLAVAVTTKKSTPTRRAGPYALFVKEHFSKVSGSFEEKVKRISQLWKQKTTKRNV